MSSSGGSASDGSLKQAVLIGAGRMGGAMMRGWLRDLKAAGLSSLVVVETQPDSDVQGAAKAGQIKLNPDPAVSDIVVLAVKPQSFGAVAADLKRWVGPDTLVISIMAGITIDRITKALGSQKVARAMPNTPGSIGKGVTGYSLSPACAKADGEATSHLLSELGPVVGPLAESNMDAVTAVSGSGPAYVFLLVETLAAAGKAAGLDEQTANALARQTIIGAGALLDDSPQSPAELRKAVTSPGGTTAAALEVLMANGALPNLMRHAVEAAVKRGAEVAKDVEKKV
jgi:pyrroline-5-carboxylate reductase